MNKIGLGGALLIWTGFLWPFVITAIFIVTLGHRLAKRARYFAQSVIGGYAIIFLTPIDVMVDWLFPVPDIEIAQMNSEERRNIMRRVTVGLITLAILPPAVSVVLLKWHWKGR